MALMATGTCIKCGNEMWYNARRDSSLTCVCNNCKQLELDEKKQAFMDERRSHSLEKRIEWIEEWIFNHQEFASHYKPPARLF